MRTLDFSGLASPPRVSVLGETASVFYAQYWLNQIGIETSTTEDSQVIVEAGRPAGPSPLDPPIGGSPESPYGTSNKAGTATASTPQLQPEYPGS